MKIGSLFAGGCGGLELGLERAGVGHTIWQVEIDESARRNLKRHWPNARQYADVKEFRYVDGIERPDVICGGFPCQDVSIAGAGKGLEGSRSGLWYEYLRIVREMAPRFVVVENVVALSFRGLGAVIGGLSEAGYSAIWFPLRAADVGATHRRERLFIVAYSDREGQPQQKGPVSESGGWTGDGGGNVGDPYRGDGARREPDPERSAEQRVAAEGTSEVLGYANGPRLEGRGVRGCGRADERAPGAAGSEMGHEFPPGPGDYDGWRDYLARFPNRAPAILTPMPANRHGNARRGASLNPVFVEALQGFPEGWTEGTRSQRLKQLGNAVVPQCAEVVGHVLLGIGRREGLL